MTFGCGKLRERKSSAAIGLACLDNRTGSSHVFQNNLNIRLVAFGIRIVNRDGSCGGISFSLFARRKHQSYSSYGK
jgi:hypothetical protein